jgi:hypothetical protein
MWLEAFPISSLLSVVDAISLVLTAAAMTISVVAFSKALGSQYEIRGSRAGLLLSILGVVAYLWGTSLQSDVVHLLSISVLYWGCVLSLGGVRSLVPTIPGGLLFVSLFVPKVSSLSSLWGLPYVEGLSWAVIVASVVLLLNSRRSVEPLGCGLCASFKREGESFCRSCGRLLQPNSIPFPRKSAFALVAFTVAMVALFSFTVPLVTASPGTTFVSYGLGGAQSSAPLPLSGWAAKSQALSASGQQFGGYLLTSGKESVEAYVTSSTDPQVVASALQVARGNSTNSTALPSSLNRQVSGYSLTLHGVSFIDLQGIYQVTMLNGSQAIRAFLGFDLRQSTASFRADNGTALYGVSSALIGWASNSDLWFPYVAGAVSAFQLFTLGAYLFSFAAVVVVLFTVARDDELAKVRREESSHSLPKAELDVLGAFAHGTGWMTGEQILESVRKLDPAVSDSEFFTALEGVSKRGLLHESVVLRKGAPTLLWRSFF